MVARRGWSFACWSLVVAGLAMIFLGGAGIVQAAEVRVNMGDNFFDPATVTVNVGDTVTWTHSGNRPHDVTADNGAFSSPRRMSNGQTFTYTATTAGSFAYTCTIHPAQMRATVVVRAAGAPAAPAPAARAPRAAMPRTGGGGMASDSPVDHTLLFGLGLAMLVGVAAAAAWRRAIA
jgi:plastocyanin